MGITIGRWHTFRGVSSYGCALAEGWANYYTGVTRGPAIGSNFEDAGSDTFIRE